MTTDREREDKRRWELLGILRGEPSWKECQEAADEMEILMRENEALREELNQRQQIINDLETELRAA